MKESRERMKQISIDKTLSDKCNVGLACLFYEVNVTDSSQNLWEFIENDAIDKAKYTIENIAKDPIIASAKRVYKMLGKDPSRYRIASEALRRRIAQNKELYHVNNIVDIGNLVSIETGYASGSYDTDKIIGDIVFGVGNIGEEYEGIGHVKINIENLPIFRDSIGPFGSPTRDSLRTMIDSNSKKILTVFISFDGTAGLKDAVSKMENYLKTFAGVEKVQIMMIGRENL